MDPNADTYTLNERIGIGRGEEGNEGNGNRTEEMRMEDRKGRIDEGETEEEGMSRIERRKDGKEEEERKRKRRRNGRWEQKIDQRKGR